MYCNVMEQYYEYYLAAVIVLIPLTSISHFIPPLPICFEADLCNHTWIPECAQEWDYDYRMFIDECDVLEYNCDYDRNYTITNYSDCFGMPASCPPIPTCPACPTCKQCRMRRMFDPVATVPVNQRRVKLRHDHGGHEGHQHFVEHIHLVGGHRGVGTLPQAYGTARKPDRTRGPANPNMRRYHLLPGRRLRERTKKKKKKKKKTTKRTTTTTTTTKPSKKKPKMKTKTTKQIIETATMATAFKTTKYTILKNGKKYNKVVKYIVRKVLKTTKGKGNAIEKQDSDYLEK